MLQVNADRGNPAADRPAPVVYFWHLVRMLDLARRPA